MNKALIVLAGAFVIHVYMTKRPGNSRFGSRYHELKHSAFKSLPSVFGGDTSGERKTCTVIAGGTGLIVCTGIVCDQCSHIEPSDVDGYREPSKSASVHIGRAVWMTPEDVFKARTDSWMSKLST